MTGGDVVLYRPTCARCRVLSAVLVLLSAGGLRREPIDARLADDLAAGTGTKARLLVLAEGRILTGPVAASRIVAGAIPRWTAAALVFIGGARLAGAL